MSSSAVHYHNCPSELYQIILFCKLSSSRKYEHRTILICSIVFKYVEILLKEEIIEVLSLILYTSNELQHEI